MFATINFSAAYTAKKISNAKIESEIKGIKNNWIKNTVTSSQLVLIFKTTWQSIKIKVAHLGNAFKRTLLFGRGGKGRKEAESYN